MKYGLFGQVSKSFLNNRFGISAGIRTDGNTFTDEQNILLQTISPRLSFSYALTDQWNFSASVGKYFKTPIYPILGYQNNQGTFVNKNTAYTQSIHYVAGVEFIPDDALRITVEGFYKQYHDYPVSIATGISLANQGGDFGAIGNEPVVSNGKGRTFGVEFFLQKKLTNRIFYILSYTWYSSKFSGRDGEYISSSWDNENLLSALLGRKFNNGWELGLKNRFAGGAPYTPFDLEASRLNYLSLGVGVDDFDRLNVLRLKSFNQLDFRLDKKWNLRRFTFDLYVDVQNVFAFKTPSTPEYTFERNSDGSYKTLDGQPIQPDGSNAIPIILRSDDPFFVPTVGFIIEF
jgi:hypothetical protein